MTPQPLAVRLDDPPPSSTLFGYKPEPESLTTATGCARVFEEIRLARGRIMYALHCAKRPVLDRTPYEAELLRLATMAEYVGAQLKVRRDAADATREPFARAFMRIVRASVSKEEFDAFVMRAEEEVTALLAQPNSAAHGPVLEPRAGGGGIRVRRG